MSSSWHKIHTAFKPIVALELRQTWLPEPKNIEKGFIKTAWNGSSVLIYSEFEDSYIFNPATCFNDPARPLAVCRTESFLNYHKTLIPKAG
jgi:hypothetical protein